MTEHGTARAPAGALTPESRSSRHGPIAQLLIALSPLSAILLLYASAQWASGAVATGGVVGATNRLGLPLHVADQPAVDRAVFGVVPSVWLQAHLVDGSAHWYDALAALVYATHFVSIPLVTGVVWFRLRERYAAWLIAVLTFIALGVAGYVLYPAAPPWLASAHGQIGPVHRISDLGWHYLYLEPIARLSASGQGESNPVAAMPSLHAGAAFLVAAFCWPVVNRWWRALLVLYVLLMAFALVYTGEHYVLDVLVGWCVAAVGVSAGAARSRRRPRVPPRQKGLSALPNG